MNQVLTMADGSDPYKEVTERLLPDAIREIARVRR